MPHVYYICMYNIELSWLNFFQSVSNCKPPHSLARVVAEHRTRSVGRQATGVKSDSLSIGRAHTQPSWKSFVCAIKTDNIGLDDIKSYVARRHLYSKNPAYFIVLLVYSEIFFCSTRAQHGTAFLRFFICK